MSCALRFCAVYRNSGSLKVSGVGFDTAFPWVCLASCLYKRDHNTVAPVTSLHNTHSTYGYFTTGGRAQRMSSRTQNAVRIRFASGAGAWTLA